MPELPEVETVRNGLAPVMDGNRIKTVQLNRPDLRFPFPENFADRLSGAKVHKTARRAKYLLFHLDTGETLLCHLGMSGSFLALKTGEAVPPDRNTKHDHVLFKMSDDAMLIYNDPRRFGFMDLFATDDMDKSKFLKNLGAEPTGNEISATKLLQQLSTRKGPIKSALLDQRIIAGLGNIYVCEILFRTGVHPAMPACDLTPKQIEDMVDHTRNIIREAIISGGSSLKDFTNADGDLGYFQHSFDVYGRNDQPCRKPGCGHIIERIVQSGRSSFYCPDCQKQRLKKVSA